MSDKKVYTCFCTDVIHEGHLNIIKKAKELGSVTVGVLCDSEMVRYNRFPQKSVEEKIEMIKAIPGVDNVIVQNHIMYDEVVKELRPDYIVHGNNWSSPAMAVIKENILSLLAEYGGELVEVPYTFNEAIQKRQIKKAPFHRSHRKDHRSSQRYHGPHRREDCCS